MNPLTSINRWKSQRQRFVATGAIAVAGLVIGACGQSTTDSATRTLNDDTNAATNSAGAADVAYGLVDPKAAAELATRSDIVVIDVRTPAEYAEGHLAGATLIDYNGAEFAVQIGELDAADTYLVYCRSGSRSANATAAMRAAGIDQLYELDGGIVAWTDAGLDVTTD